MDVLETVMAKLNEGDYKSALDIVADPANDATIKIQSMDLISLIADNLTEENAENKPDLYSTTEALLNRVAQKCSPPEVLYELMEKIRLATSDEVFTSLLKVMQVAVLRLPAKRARCLEWVFNTIIEYLDRIVMPEVLYRDMDERDEILLESEETIRRLLQLYITLLLFLDPIAKHLDQPSTSIYFDVHLTQKNGLICFILRLMGKLFPFLQLQSSGHSPNNLQQSTKLPAGKSYSIQVAEDMIGCFVRLVKNPLFLLPYGEKRNKIQPKGHEQDSEDNTNNDCFLGNESYTTEGFAMLYYLLLGEHLLPASVPRIYDDRYIFEMVLHHVVVLLGGDAPMVYFKGIRLAEAVVKLLKGTTLSSQDLDSQIHTTFCERFIRALERSGSERNRKVGIHVLTDYIHSFDDAGRYTIISYMLKKYDDDSVRSYAISVYKDWFVKAILNQSSGEPLVRWLSGDVLKDMLTNYVCVLKHGVKTDLLDHAYSITSALSALWVLLKTDQANRSNIWDYYGTLEKQFLLELRMAIDLTRAHYMNELKLVTEGNDHPTATEQEPEFSINALNGESPAGMSNEKKVELCHGMILRLDMLEFQLARINGEIDLMKRNMNRSNSVQAMKTE